MARAYETSLENDKLLHLSADELIGMLWKQNGMTVQTVILKGGYVMQGSVTNHV